MTSRTVRTYFETGIEHSLPDVFPRRLERRLERTQSEEYIGWAAGTANGYSCQKVVVFGIIRFDPSVIAVLKYPHRGGGFVQVQPTAEARDGRLDLNHPPPPGGGIPKAI